jgi:uncharacterized protein YndB with AHSA1/START domain
MAAAIVSTVLINADQRTVWLFMSEPARFLSWMTLAPGVPAPAGSLFEPTTNGALRILFPSGGGAKGIVLEIDAPRLLAFSWGYDPDVSKTGLRPGSCRVEIVLQGSPDGTLATLTCTGSMSPEQAQLQEAGWRQYLAQLAVQSSMAFHQPRMGDTLQAYFSACNEPDRSKRDALLALSCESAIRIRSQSACSDTLPDFSAHIASVLRQMPGCAWAQNGLVTHVHGIARVPWAIRSPEGKIMFRGENLVHFTPRGKIGEIVTFPG